ncbi:MAG: hypothetical protein HZA61_08915 [Candidatus Eisenbacteria bacterium]|uniref:Glycosyl hydrolase family 32 N-terminal domain-containing protein n=1 Tax=Eiseniibacteriota bacterium TaxID=2212470 RepID=A0A933SE40_UNCEI|nr:hypothetical protein [Candidatus Eisenbacteria bacterium]
MCSWSRSRVPVPAPPGEGRANALRRRLSTLLLAALALVMAAGLAHGDSSDPVYPVTVETTPNLWSFHDPDRNVSTKEFTWLHNVVTHYDTLSLPDTTIVTPRLRQLFHLIYQRTGGVHSGENTFGHAWSGDMAHWVVDTLAFAVDTTWWNRRHVWAPSLVEANGRTYMFYTGVDEQNDQRIGYATTSVLDTSNTVWDSTRPMVWEASRTKWAVPDPPVYLGQTQFRDAFVMHDPEHAGRLLMYYGAHDSIDARLNRGAMAVGVARSDSANFDQWHDLGYFPKTLRRVTGIPQLEGPHVFSANGTKNHWRLMFTNAGSPPGENGGTTIRFLSLTPGASPADTSAANWSGPTVLRDYLNGVPTSYGWSGSEHLRVANAEYLGGFTAWSINEMAISWTRVVWNGTNFTLSVPNVTSVDEYRSPARALTLALLDHSPGTAAVRFAIDSPLALEAKLEVFDAQGRRMATPFAGALPVGRTDVTWDLRAGGGAAVPSGVYFARLRFAGGGRTARVVVAR